MLSAAAAGCTDLDASPDEGVVTSKLACVGVDCPGNSKLFATLGVYELSTAGKESPRGFSIDKTKIWRGPHQLHDFKVVGTTTTATTNTGQHIENTELTEEGGTKIRVRHAEADFDLWIRKSMAVPYYGDPIDPAEHPQPTFYGYYIQYAEATAGGDQRWRDLCPVVDAKTGGKSATWAVIWSGERIDPSTGMLFVDPDESWFSISCAGTAEVHMLQAGSGLAVNPAASLEEAQATHDMFTARYCPDSYERYTGVGTKVYWDSQIQQVTSPKNTAMEAIWNGNGAVCLDYTRTGISKNKLACALPECTAEMEADWTSLGYLRSKRLGFSVLAP